MLFSKVNDLRFSSRRSHTKVLNDLPSPDVESDNNEDEDAVRRGVPKSFLAVDNVRGDEAGWEMTLDIENTGI